MSSIKYLTDGNDWFYYTGEEEVWQVFGLDGDDIYYIAYDDGPPEIIEAEDGGIDSVYLPWRVFHYTLPENVENLFAGSEGGDKGYTKHFNGNDLDNVMDFDLDGPAGNKANQIVASYGGDDWVRLGVGDDWADLGDGDDEGRGGYHNDTIYGGLGDDLIYGGSHDDSLYGEEDRDLIYGESGRDFIDGGPGYDTLYGGDDADIIYGGWGSDYIDGGAGGDKLYGGDRNDQIFGRAGKDTIEGGAGNDRMFGGANQDTYIFKDGDFGKDEIRGYTTSYEDQFVFSSEYWGGEAPDIAHFMETYVSFVGEGMNAMVDLREVGGGTVKIIGLPGETFDMAALAEDISFL